MNKSREISPPYLTVEEKDGLKSTEPPSTINQVTNWEPTIGREGYICLVTIPDTCVIIEEEVLTTSVDNENSDLLQVVLRIIEGSEEEIPRVNSPDKTTKTQMVERRTIAEEETTVEGETTVEEETTEGETTVEGLGETTVEGEEWFERSVKSSTTD